MTYTSQDGQDKFVLEYLNEIINDPTFEHHKDRLTDNYNFFMGKLNQ
jgi:hypothetical protein